MVIDIGNYEDNDGDDEGSTEIEISEPEPIEDDGGEIDVDSSSNSSDSDSEEPTQVGPISYTGQRKDGSTTETTTAETVDVDTGGSTSDSSDGGDYVPDDFDTGDNDSDDVTVERLDEQGNVEERQNFEDETEFEQSQFNELDNREDRTREELRRAAEEIAGSERFQGTRRGRQAGQLAQQLQNNRQPTPRPRNQAINPENLEPVTDNELRQMGVDPNSKNTFTADRPDIPTRLKMIPGSRDGTVSSSSFAIQSLEEEQRAKDQFIQTEFERNPGFATAGTVQSATGSEQTGLVAGTAVSSVLEPVNALRNADDVVKNFLDDPVEFQDEVTSLEDPSFAQAEGSRAEFDRTSSNLQLGASALGAAGAGTLAGGSVSGVTRTGAAQRTINQGIDTAKSTARKIDPATGIGRTRRPGELTRTTPERVRNRADNFVDFLKGDIQPETRRRPDARNVKIDTDPDGVRFENQDTTEETFVDPTELDSDADRIAFDERGDVPVEVFERNRRDVLNERFNELAEGVNERLNSGAIGSGPGALLKRTELEDKTPELEDSDFIRRIDDQDRRTDVDTGNLRRRGRNRLDRPERRTRFNIERRDSDLTEEIGLGLGLGTGQQQEPVNTLTEDQENPVVERTDEDTESITERFVDDIFDSDQNRNRQREDSFLRRPEEGDRILRERDRDFDSDDSFDVDFEEELEAPEDEFVGGTEEGEFASSLTAGIFDLEAEEDFNEEEFVGTGLEIRPLL